MNTTDSKLLALQARIAHNRQLLCRGATMEERWQLQHTAAVPLAGMAFVAGLLCGGGASWRALQIPLVRGALRTLYSIGEVSIDGFQ